jgi:hypothetical protein
MARELATFCSHPGIEVGHERRDAGGADGKALLGGKALISRSTSKITSIRFTASKASGAMTASLPRALAVTSASTKNLRRLCDQKAASLIDPGLRPASQGRLKPA